MNADLSDTLASFDMSGSSAYAEDDSGRIEVDLTQLPTIPLVSGLCAGFYGYESSSSGCFVVKEVCFPAEGKDIPTPLSISVSPQSNGKVIFISGIGPNPASLFTALTMLDKVFPALNNIILGIALHILRQFFGVL